MNELLWQEVVSQLSVLSEKYCWIEHAGNGYALWYENEADDMPYPPDKVQMRFEKQSLRFSRYPYLGSIPPYVTTKMSLIVAGKEFGYYLLHNHLDGTTIDDSIGWGEPKFYELPDSPDTINDEQDINVQLVPTDLQWIFKVLEEQVHEQKLIEQARSRCRQWFVDHPRWYEGYPQSLTIDVPDDHVLWFIDHPRWYEGYPVNTKFTSYNPETRFSRHDFCFRHAAYSFSFMLTKMDIFADGYEIGSYYLATRSDGSCIEQLTGILPFPF